MSAHKLKTFFGFILFLIGWELLYIFIIWPDWESLAKGPIRESNYIAHFREKQQGLGKKALPLRWYPRENLGLTSRQERVFVLAEDSKFYEHHGVDWEAVEWAIDYNWKRGELKVGASTITQQTVKNMFLSHSRNPLRKWHELLLTWGIERNLSKKRILTLYLNIAEFGPGIFGVEAAARHYFRTSARNLGPQQLAALAASLPSPIKNNPATSTRRFNKRKNKIAFVYERYLRGIPTKVKVPPPELEAEPPALAAEPTPAATPTAATQQPVAVENGANEAAPPAPPDLSVLSQAAIPAAPPPTPPPAVAPEAHTTDELRDLNFDTSEGGQSDP
jgi:monofunctional biosynthetic peptidoglycan transglycosylase